MNFYLLYIFNNVIQREFPATKGIVATNLNEINNLLKEQKIDLNTENLLHENTTVIYYKFQYAAGIQSLVLKWTNYDFVSFESYNYVRVKKDFIFSETDKYTIALIGTDDNNIGVVILIPSNSIFFYRNFHG